MPLGGGSSALLTLLLPGGFDWRILFKVGGTLPLLLIPALYFLLQETVVRSGRSSAVPGRMAPLEALFGGGRAVPTLLLWTVFLPTLFILYLFLNWLPTLVVAKGLDRAVASQASLLFNFGSVLGALVLGWMVDRLGHRWPLSLAFAGLIAVVLVLAGSADATMLVVLSGAAGFFLLGANYAMYGVAPAYYPADARGTGSGGSIAIGRVGSILGPLVAGLLQNSGWTAVDVMRYMAPVAAVAGIAVAALSFCRRAD
jgi:AAHS family 3-hydroxyphenylpropionic acid transporter